MKPARGKASSVVIGHYCYQVQMGVWYIIVNHYSKLYNSEISSLGWWNIFATNKLELIIIHQIVRSYQDNQENHFMKILSACSEEASFCSLQELRRFQHVIFSPKNIRDFIGRPKQIPGFIIHMCTFDVAVGIVSCCM